MAKHSFRMGGSGKQVMVVPTVDSDVGTMPTVTIDAVASEVVSDERAAGWPDVRLSPRGIDPMGVGAAGDVPQGWDFAGGETDQVADIGQGGSVILSDVGTVVASLAYEPDVMNTLQALRADDDGMGMMEAIEVAPVDQMAFPVDVGARPDGLFGIWAKSGSDVDVTDAAIEVAASEPVVSPFAALVAAHKPVVADCVVSVALLPMLTVDARAMAQRIADLTGVAVTVTGPDGAESIAPRSRGAKVARVASEAAPRAKAAERDWLAFDGVAQWGASDKPWSIGYVKIWREITAAGRRMDLDALLAFDFHGAHEDGKGNSFSKTNGSVLRAWIAKVREGQAAIDAEFGIKLAAD